MDKISHVIYSLIGSAFLTVMLHNYAGALLAAVVASSMMTAIGIAKELYDRAHGGIFDWGDLLCDIAGAIAGAAMVVLLWG